MPDHDITLSAQYRLTDLSEQKTDAKNTLSSYIDETLYRPEQIKELQQILAEANAEIDAATNPQSVADALAKAKLKINAVKTDAQLKAEDVETITAANVSLAQTTLTYNGKAQTPAITAKDKNGKTVAAANYTIAYANNINVGTASVTITFNGSYTGTVQKTFQIIPKGTTLSKVKANKNGFTAKWKKQKVQTDGYEIQYATNSKFKKQKTIKNIKAKKSSRTVSKLKANKKYFVRIRTYKKVGGTTYYSDWSRVKKVKTKK